MTEQPYKSLFASRTFWTQIVGTGASMLALWKIDVSPEDQALLVTGIVGMWAVVNVILRVATNKRIGKPE